jgi:hypothetical protein
VRLLEALHAVDGLDEVVELEADAREDLAVAVALEVAAAAGDHRLGGEDAVLAVAEVDDALLALLEVLAAPHADRLRQRILDGVALVLEVVPDDEVIRRRRLRPARPPWRRAPAAVPLLACAADSPAPGRNISAWPSRSAPALA